jgi:hypothetical protein
MYIVPSSSTMTLSATNGTMTQTSSTATTFYGWYISPTTHMSAVTLANITINAGDSGTAVYTGIAVPKADIGTLNIYNNSITMSGATGTTGMSGIIVDQTTGSQSATTVNVYNNTVVAPINTTQTAAYGIRVGTDGSDGFTPHYGAVSVYGNQVTGESHGYCIGNGVLNAQVYGNLSTNSQIGEVDKLDTGSWFYYNLIINPTTGPAIWIKGATNTQHFNETAYLTASGTPYGYYVSQDPTAPTLSTGIVVKNGAVYSSGISSPDFVFVGTTGENDTVTFSNMDYYATGASSLNWLWRGTTYTSLAAWLAAGHDTASLGTNPLFTNASGTFSSASDFIPGAGSPLIAAGQFTGLPYDFAGNAVTCVPNIGVYETSGKILGLPQIFP